MDWQQVKLGKSKIWRSNIFVCLVDMDLDLKLHYVTAP